MSAAGMSSVERVRAAYARIAEADRPEVWITLRPVEDALADAERIDAAVASGTDLPLAGTTLAVKDNIDVAGLPTTAACPGFASVPGETAPAVARLVAAGAVVLGKTNLDQFATGLVGTRSPYGAVRDATRPELISGGSSSGSAVAVALGIADLALGTDTAGSGRVPAAFQGIVGIKPTRGLVPNAGVVPAARSYDCVTVFARTLAEAELAIGIMTGVAAGDPSGRAWPADAPLAAPPRPRVAVPPSDQLDAMSPEWVAAFERAAKDLEAAGAELVPVDLAPFLEAARLLYDGALVAERHAAVGGYVDAHWSLDGGDADLDPTVAGIIGRAGTLSASDLVRDVERLDRLRLVALAALEGADAMLVPTVPEHPTLAEVAADPVGVNSRLGTYTNFMNLLDLCGVAVPAGGLESFGVTVVARAFGDRVAADVARLLPAAPGPLRAPRELTQIGVNSPAPSAAPPGVPLVVVGAHLSGLPLNSQLTGVGARLLGTVRTAPTYRMFALATEPPKPGLVRVDSGGGSVEGELWSLPPAGLAALLAGLPAPMALGKVVLDDGSDHVGFLCEPVATVGAEDITASGGWRAHLAGR